MMSDWYATLPGGSMSVTFHGLTPLQLYDLYFYSYSLRNSTSTMFTNGNTSLSAVNSGSAGVFIEGNNYVHFVGRPADASGQLSILIQGPSGQSSPGGIVNGIQIAAVPEPGAFGLFLAGVVGVLGAKLRRYAHRFS